MEAIILDIHTHKSEVESEGKSIINCRLREDVPSLRDSAPSFGDSAPSFGDSVQTADALLFCAGYYYSAGIHPYDAAGEDTTRRMDLLRRLLVREQFVAVGEAGLDKLAEASMEVQMAVFREQVAVSEEYKLPLIIHCVRAMEELLAVKKEMKPVQAWIWHGFRGKPEQAVQLLKKGFYLSFGEFYSEEAMRVVPDECLFLETDESAGGIEEILCRAAKVRGAGVEALRETVGRNIRNVFFCS